MSALLGLDQLQSGADGVSGGVGSAAQQAVSLAHLDQHGAEVVGLLQQSSALLSGLLALAQLDHGVDHLIETCVVLRVDDLGSGNIIVASSSGSLALCLIADHNHFQHALSQQLACGLQDAGVIALGKNDRLGVRFQLGYQRCKHISHCDYLRNNFCNFSWAHRSALFFILAQSQKTSRQNRNFVVY